jgi:hypothetical protein
MWFGYPHEGISQKKFFKLSRALAGMVKLHKGVSAPLREGMLHAHFVVIFRYIDEMFTKPTDIFVARPMEAHLLITMWQAGDLSS